MITKAISVRAPWWWFILHEKKDIENRDWSTNFRGTVYLHSSKWFSKPKVIEDAHLAVAWPGSNRLFQQSSDHMGRDARRRRMHRRQG
jgi:hypothetical protein